MLTNSKNRRILYALSSNNRRKGEVMKASYTGAYRTRLTTEERKAFKQLALSQGEVTEVHDSIIRQYIKKEGDKRHGASCNS